jgi:DNA/RNA endonuclease G (NUC1)
MGGLRIGPMDRALLFAFAFIFVATAQARNCTADEKAAADKQLWLNNTDKLIAYSGELRVPIWTAHRLQGKVLGKVERVNCFRQDPRLKATAASSPSDYKEPIFDQGHLTPNIHVLLPLGERSR